ncbi:hypothetical protein C2S51_032691 [Perilla frutescens var. frutescens]|nr:hypothetical protein C2S51_032691 [Perilla frutescens var. frutescens]
MCKPWAWQEIGCWFYRKKLSFIKLSVSFNGRRRQAVFGGEPSLFQRSKGRMFSDYEEERAKETVYIQKMERERMEKLKKKAEREKAEKDKSNKDKLPHKYDVIV